MAYKLNRHFDEVLEGVLIGLYVLAAAAVVFITAWSAFTQPPTHIPQHTEDTPAAMEAAWVSALQSERMERLLWKK